MRRGSEQASGHEGTICRRAIAIGSTLDFNPDAPSRLMSTKTIELILKRGMINCSCFDDQPDTFSPRDRIGPALCHSAK